MLRGKLPPWNSCCILHGRRGRARREFVIVASPAYAGSAAETGWSVVSWSSIVHGTLRRRRLLASQSAVSLLDGSLVVVGLPYIAAQSAPASVGWRCPAAISGRTSVRPSA